jgi:hypothetical protein
LLPPGERLVYIARDVVSRASIQRMARRKTVKNIVKGALVVAMGTFLFASPALAKGGKGTPQNHHCMKDGAEMAGKTKKQCKTDGGTWEKMEAPKTETPPPAAK